MARHQNYSKRSRASRQAMVGGNVGDQLDHYSDYYDTGGEERVPREIDPGLRSARSAERHSVQ